MPYCLTCDKHIDKADYVACDVCFKDGCTDCMGELQFVSFSSIKFVWFHKQGIEDTCTSCLHNKEKEFLETLPRDQLPLLINERWNDLENDKLYRDLLKGVSL